MSWTGIPKTTDLAPPPPCNPLISDRHWHGGKFSPSGSWVGSSTLSWIRSGSVVAAFVLAITTFGFGGEAQADNHIQVSGCAGTEGTNYYAEDHLVYCSSAATGSDVSISLEDATILLPTNFVGWSGVWGYHTGTGNINIKAEGGSVTTPTLLNANGIYGYHTGTGDIDIKVLQGHAVMTEGSSAHGVYGLHWGTGNLGNLGINVHDSAITTSGANAYGIFGQHNGEGDISIKAEGSSVTTSGAAARAVYGWHQGIGNIDILIKGSTLTTSGVTPLGDGSRAVFGLRGGTRGNLDINVQDSSITASGFGIHARNRGTGDVSIEVKGSTVTSSGNAIYGLLEGDDGNVDIKVLEDSTITASGRGIHANNRGGTGNINIEVKDSTVESSGDAIAGNLSGVGNTSIVVQNSTVSASGRGIHGNHGSGDLRIDVRSSTITTTRDGIYGQYGGTGNLDIDVRGSAVTTSGATAHAVYGWHTGTGNLDINVQDGTLKTSGANAHGIYGQHLGTGDIDIKVLQGHAVMTEGSNAHAVYGWHTGTGNLGINVHDSAITTSGANAHAVYGWHTGTGNLGINVHDSAITTSGYMAYGIYGLHQGDGDLGIRLADGLVTTSGDGAHGIYARNLSEGGIAARIENGVVRATGMDAHGIQVGSLDENGVVQGSVGVDAEGYRRQSVTVGSEVRGGSGDAAGIFLAGGGRVMIGPHGRVGAVSGIAVRAAGTGPQGEPGPLSVNLMLNARPLEEVLGGGRIVNDDGTIELIANGVILFDGAAGATNRWAPNGVWDVRGRAAEDGGVGFTQAYAPRAALYESLPGLLLRLDAGAPVQRPEEPAWVRLAYGVGSGDPKRSRVGATYDFDRIEAIVGISRAWGDSLGGSVWLRHLQSEMKVDVPGSSGELDLHGVGAGVQAHWREAEGLYVSGELSLTDFDVDATSSRHGRLVRDVGAELWQARLEAGYLMAQEGEGLTLQPRAWAWHAEMDVDGFTDAVGARVLYSDESRSAVGLGVLAYVVQSEYSLYGSLDMESVFSGEKTAVEVSGQRLTSELKRTRVLAGMGGRWQGQRVTLRGGLRLADPGGRNQEVSASVSIGGSF